MDTIYTPHVLNKKLQKEFCKTNNALYPPTAQTMQNYLQWALNSQGAPITPQDIDMAQQIKQIDGGYFYTNKSKPHKIYYLLNVNMPALQTAIAIYQKQNKIPILAHPLSDAERLALELTFYTTNAKTELNLLIQNILYEQSIGLPVSVFR